MWRGREREGCIGGRKWGGGRIGWQEMKWRERGLGIVGNWKGELDRRVGGRTGRRKSRKQGEQEAGIYVVLISVITPPPRVPGSSQQPVDDT